MKKTHKSFVAIFSLSFIHVFFFSPFLLSTRIFLSSPVSPAWGGYGWRRYVDRHASHSGAHYFMRQEIWAKFFQVFFPICHYFIRLVRLFFNLKFLICLIVHYRNYSSLRISTVHFFDRCPSPVQYPNYVSFAVSDQKITLGLTFYVKTLHSYEVLYIV